uniref:Uncharacterized protein n=1 Tax=Meloidogyne enterolobii TaxID=390850 RepID=A0A6V7VZ85_MELEN|nr:unnamed protein product [Meloidogyne enterolobii]
MRCYLSSWLLCRGFWSRLVWVSWRFGSLQKGGRADDKSSIGTSSYPLVEES